MNQCRVCRSQLAEPTYFEPPPGLTSLATELEIPTRVTVCTRCGHAQSDDLPDSVEFYGTQYRISLESEEHDQLYAEVAGQKIFRTARQAELVLSQTNLPKDAVVLDYGGAKAATLKEIFTKRPDIVPHVFDVSSDYSSYWSAWLPRDHCAIGQPPPEWRRRFDLVTAHFVLEHVPDPVATLRDIRGLLKDDGQLF